jgi:predicted nicotinamide N-methyase
MLIQEIAYDDEYDAAAVLMQRGEFLRRLRELERQDEQERGREEEDTHSQLLDATSNTRTLDYQSYLANQNYYDDYKHVNYHQIDFGMIGNRRVIIQQSRDKETGKGGLVWDAGFILADHLIQTKELWNPTHRPVKMVELGAGTGVTGLMAAAFPESKVHLTDLSPLMPLLNTNAKGFENATVGELEWGTTTTNLEKYDIIVGSDVVASIYDSSALAKTIYDLADQRSQVYLACRDRLAGSIEQFEVHLTRLFANVCRRKATSTNRNPDVWILHVSGRRDNQ